MISNTYRQVEQIALKEFGEIILNTQIIHSQTGRARKLRINIFDGSYVDVWLSVKGKDYSYHWERRLVNGKIFRHDNAPHNKWKKIKTFPKHFHNGKEEKAKDSYISGNPQRAIREFLKFVKETMKAVI